MNQLSGGIRIEGSIEWLRTESRGSYVRHMWHVDAETEIKLQFDRPVECHLKSAKRCESPVSSFVPWHQLSNFAESETCERFVASSSSSSYVCGCCVCHIEFKFEYAPAPSIELGSVFGFLIFTTFDPNSFVTPERRPTGNRQKPMSLGRCKVYINN